MYYINNYNPAFNYLTRKQSVIVKLGYNEAVDTSYYTFTNSTRCQVLAESTLYPFKVYG